MKKRTSYIIILSVIAISIILDLLTKIYFQNTLGDRDITIIPDFFKFTYVENTGAAYGMFGGNPIALAIVSIIFIAAFVIYDIFNHSNSWWYTLGIGFIIGGAIGNLIDRVFLGYVRDFISIKLFSFVFNLADLFITVGVALLVVFFVICIVQEGRGNKVGKDNKEGK